MGDCGYNSACDNDCVFCLDADGNGRLKMSYAEKIIEARRISFSKMINSQPVEFLIKCYNDDEIFYECHDGIIVDANFEE